MKGIKPSVRPQQGGVQLSDLLEAALANIDLYLETGDLNLLVDNAMPQITEAINRLRK